MIRAQEMAFRVQPVERIEGVKVRTLASIDLVIDGQAVWPTFGQDDERLEFFADDLLSHLAECWKPLLLRQTYPISVQPERPSLLRVKAAERWASMSTQLVEDEEERVAAFEDVHELTNAFAGLYGLQPLWMLRGHDDLVVETAGRVWTVPLDVAVEALTKAGDQLQHQLSSGDKARWKRLRDAWRAREAGRTAVLVSFALGVSSQTADGLLRDGVIEAPASFADLANDNDELRVAARLSGALRPDEIKEVVELVRACPLRSAPGLDALTARALNEPFGTGSSGWRPFEEGVAGARWLRGALGIAEHRPIDPFEILQAWNVDAREIALGSNQLDAVAVWGRRYGPAVVMNTKSARFSKSDANFRSQGAVRATAAHEICHLLLDRATTLAAVEVLQSRMPVRIEQRARAFAGEFLLPSATAAAAWGELKPTRDTEVIEGLLKRLCSRFRVTRSLAAWKLEHGVDDPDLSALLDRLVPNRRGSIRHEYA